MRTLTESKVLFFCSYCQSKESGRRFSCVTQGFGSFPQSFQERGGVFIPCGVFKMINRVVVIFSSVGA